MKRTFTTDEQTWVTSLLEDAAAYMRGVIGFQVYPSRQATYTAYPSGGTVNLPQSPIRSVDSVQQNGQDVAFSRFEDSVEVGCSGSVDVTFTFGMASPPGDLVGINCALVSGPMLSVEAGVGLTAGGLSSVALDDFKAAWAASDTAPATNITPATEKYLRDTYGRNGWVVGTRR